MLRRRHEQRAGARSYQRNVVFPVACSAWNTAGYFATGDESKRLFQVFRESCENAVALGCDTLMSAPGQVNGPIKDAIKYLKDAGDIAAEYKLKLAIEFNSQHDVLNSLRRSHRADRGRRQTELRLSDRRLSLHAQRRRRSRLRERARRQDLLLSVQRSVTEPVTGVRRPTDRLPPGKGVVKWREMLGLLAEKDYTGYLSYEAPNPEQWARSPYDVAREGVELTRKLLRDAVPELCHLRLTMAAEQELPLFLGFERQVDHRHSQTRSKSSAT